MNFQADIFDKNNSMAKDRAKSNLSFLQDCEWLQEPYVLVCSDVAIGESAHQNPSNSIAGLMLR